jgi:2'-hydroxyisoflavone reductase
MRLLILGGTIFLGRHLVGAALSRGHRVTLFNRGRHNPKLFPEVEQLLGDRWGDLGVLQGRSWDAVIDTSGHVPRVVQTSAQRLVDAVEHYTFISSVFAYRDFPKIPGLDEHSPLTIAADPAAERVTRETLGGLKALCEQVLANALGGHVLIVRSGVIFGPDDPTDRSSYWVNRVAQGGEVLVPGKPHRQLQLVDVRDLAQWILRCAEDRRTGVYNATGPAYPSSLTLERLLHVCKSESGSDAHLTWVPDDFLVAAGVQPGFGLPFWMPEAHDVAGINCNKAIGAGLTFRSIDETVRDTLAWNNLRQSGGPERAVITPDREAQLLRAWHANSKVPLASSNVAPEIVA